MIQKKSSCPLLIVILFCLSFFDPSLSMAQVNLSEGDEVRAGEILAAQWQKQEGVTPTVQSIEVERYLQGVGDKLGAHAQRKLPYRVLYDPNPNFKSAIGLPGGVVIVGGGILAYTDTEDQLAAVLGHEVEHIALNQCRERLLKEMSEQHITTATLDRLKINGFSAGYGHDMERAADLEGAKLMRQAGYSVNGFIRLLQTFLVLGQQMTSTAIEGQKILQERIDRIKPLLNTAKPDPPERPLHLPPALS